MKKFLYVVTLCLFMFWTQQASANRLLDKPTSVNAHLGSTSPQGVLGVTLDHQFTESFALNAGMGRGITGYQLALMSRFQVTRHDWAFGLGVGPSAGDYDEPFASIGFGSHKSVTADLVVWGNVEGYMVFQEHDGLRASVYVGCTSPLAASNVRQGDYALGESAIPESGRLTPYLGVSVGRAF